MPSVYSRNRVRRRRRVWLAALVGLSLVLLTLYFGESKAGNGGALHGVQSGAQQVFSPIESAASTIFSPVRSAFGWVGGVFSASSDRTNLQHQVASLQAQLAQAQASERDAAQLRGLVGLRTTPGFPQTQMVTAQVIARGSNIWQAGVQLDRGSADGVATNDPVVTAGGLVGRVASVGPTTAQVALITDATSGVASEIVPIGAQGVLRTRVGAPNDLIVDFLDKNAKPVPGQSIITSGGGSGPQQSLFPRGIPIGQITSVDPNELQLYGRVHVRPFADLGSMDTVQVMKVSR